MYDNRPGCGYHGFCNKGGCPINAKNATHITTIPKAVDTGNLKVVTRAHVTTLEVGSDRRVTGVNYVGRASARLSYWLVSAMVQIFFLTWLPSH